MINDLLEDLGYDSSRFEITWVSSAEPDKFSAAVTAMTSRIKQLGPINSQNTEAV